MTLRHLKRLPGMSCNTRKLYGTLPEDQVCAEKLADEDKRKHGHTNLRYLCYRR